MEDLRERVAVVTGGASGIGLGLARRFAQEGAKVVLADIEPEALQRATTELKAQGAQAVGVRTDVSKRADVEALLEQTLKAFGGVHVVCNNAGVMAAGPAWQTTQGQWEWVLGVNLWGVIHGVSVFVPHMLESGEPGHIVNTASAAGLISVPFMATYQVSKHGVVTLSESLSMELKQQGAKIGVSILCPGFVQTNLHNAERNRPQALDDGVGVDEALSQTITASVNNLIAEGKPVEEIVDGVFEAIRENRLHILTHNEARVGVRKRAALILGE